MTDSQSLPADGIKNILVITYWPMRSGLIQSYTLPYLKLILRNLPPDSRLSLITFESPEMELAAADRQRQERELGLARIDWHPFQYRRFGFRAFWIAIKSVLILLALCRTRRFAAIHSICMPAGAFGVALSLTTGIPLVLDSYEPHAEAMVENGTWKSNSLAYHLLSYFERLQSRRASAVVAVSPGMRAYAKDRYGVLLQNFFVKPACVDFNIFDPSRFDRASLRTDFGIADSIVCVYAGKTGGIYYQTEIFDLFRNAQVLWGDRFKVLFLSSDPPELIAKLAQAAHLNPKCVTHRFAEHRDVPKFMAAADFAISPIRPLPSKRLCAPIKNGEYWAMGLPTIIPPNISDDSDIIERENIGVIWDGLSDSDYQRMLRGMESLINQADSLRTRIRRIAIDKRSYPIAEEVYRRLYCRSGVLDSIFHNRI